MANINFTTSKNQIRKLMADGIDHCSKVISRVDPKELEGMSPEEIIEQIVTIMDVAAESVRKGA